ncbi:TPA: hypothetical protein ACGZ92_000646 [Elizabethkingia anophelis]
MDEISLEKVYGLVNVLVVTQLSLQPIALGPEILKVVVVFKKKKLQKVEQVHKAKITFRLSKRTGLYQQYFQRKN